MLFLHDGSVHYRAWWLLHAPLLSCPFSGLVILAGCSGVIIRAVLIILDGGPLWSDDLWFLKQALQKDDQMVFDLGITPRRKRLLDE